MHYADHLPFIVMPAISLFAGPVASQQELYGYKKKSGGIYEIKITASVSAPWHIYSQSTPEGGPIATEISFSKNPLVILKGAVSESGKLVTKHEEVFDVDVKYFDGSVSFVQTVQLKSNVKTKIRLRYLYGL